MMNWWKANVAWRLARHAPSPMATVDHAARAPCTKCSKPVEDPQYLTCRGCRVRATAISKKRRKRLARQARCQKCGHPRDSENLVCSTCCSKQRARYHAGKATAA